MSKHTPGPWYVQTDHPAGIPGADRRAITTPRGTYYMRDWTGGGVPESEHHANSRLIAETPAMLEALRAFVESAEEGGMCSVCGAEPRGNKRIGTFIPRCPSWCVAESARAILARLDAPTRGEG